LVKKFCQKKFFEKKNVNFDPKNLRSIFKSKFLIFVVGQFKIFFSTFSFWSIFFSKMFIFHHFQFRKLKNVVILEFSNFFFLKKVIFWEGGIFWHFFRFFTRFFLDFFGIFWKKLETYFGTFSVSKNSNFVKKVIFKEMNDWTNIVYKKRKNFFFFIFLFFSNSQCFSSPFFFVPTVSVLANKTN